MSFERDERSRSGGDGAEWTKEQPGRDKGFDFDAFLGTKSLEEQVTDALDGKDLLDRDAYGTFPPGYIPRRGAPGEKGRHEAPEPEPEPEYPGDPPTQRFGWDGEDPDDAAQPPQQEPPEEAPPAIKDEPPPRPKVVVADPAPRVYVTPEMEYEDEPPRRRGSGKGLKFAIALLIALAVGLAAAALVMTLLRRSGGQGTEPAAPTPTDYLFGGMPTRAPTAPPTAEPTAPPTPTPGPTPPQIVFYTVSVTAGTGGSISPSGAVPVQEGGDAVFTITPDAGYTLIQLLVDGVNVPVTDTYTFTGVQEDHVIYAIFQAVPATEPPAPTEPPATEEPETPPAPEQPDVPPQVEG